MQHLTFLSLAILAGGAFGGGVLTIQDYREATIPDNLPPIGYPSITDLPPPPSQDVSPNDTPVSSSPLPPPPNLKQADEAKNASKQVQTFTVLLANATPKKTAPHE